MRFIFRLIHTVGFWVVISSSFFIHSIITPFINMASKKASRDVYFDMCLPFIRFNQWTNQMPLTVIGREHLPEGKGYILCSNHQSLADIPLYMRAVGKHIGFFAKKELLSVPILGWDLKKLDNEIVDRKNPKAALKEMEASADRVKNGKRVLIFPEGTRSLDGHILPFKKGAFVLAAKSGAPVIPAYIHMSGYCIHKTRWYTQPGPVTIVIGKPIYPHKNENSAAEAERLKAETREAVVALSKRFETTLYSPK